MNICDECGAIEKGAHTVVVHGEDSEEYQACNVCGSEDSIIEVNEDEYYEELETDRRLAAWKDEK